MTLDLRDCAFSGPALPEPFVHFELAAQLAKLGLLTNANSKAERNWSDLRRQLKLVGGLAGPQRICNHLLVPLARQLGFAQPTRQEESTTREGLEDGGWLMQSPSGTGLRAWAFSMGANLDAPHRSGRAYRFSPTRSAQRVLLASGERIGLVTNGDELRVLLCDTARPDSHIAISLGGGIGWRAKNLVPDSYRLLLAMATPKGIAALPELLDAARLAQARVTEDLRQQARSAVEGLLQAVLDHPANSALADLHCRADVLWQEGLVLIYRLLFILKLESGADPARAFSFASTDVWREALSPNRALGPLARRMLDHGHDTGRMLEEGLRLVFRVFRDGLACSELSIAPLGGALFGAEATPLLDQLAWGERGAALLLDRLLWTTPKGRPRERVHYGALDVEELGRIYEALLELQPGIAAEPMVRLRRAKLEVVVPAYEHGKRPELWAEDIPPGRFFVRAGLGRKTTGSYYTPHGFVRFLVRETLTPQIAQRSPDNEPSPGAVLALKLVDPAIGSGHFLVEACRFLGEALYAACRQCDELAATAEAAAAQVSDDDRTRLLDRAADLRNRISNLPDPDRLLLTCLPSHAGFSAVAQSRALAICRRLIAVHCLYGVDNNRLAIELAKLSLWLESYAEGLPLTFLDHRLVHGDSISGACFASLAKLPVGGEELDPLLARHVRSRLDDTLLAALREVRVLQATVGADAADVLVKLTAKQRLDAILRPLQLLARCWSGAAMLATRDANDEWLALARIVAVNGAWPDLITGRQASLLAAGGSALPWDLTFPEVFWPNGGFDVVLSNPPWDIMQPNSAEFLAGYDLSILDATDRRAAQAIEHRLLADGVTAHAWQQHREGFARQHRVVDRLYTHQRSGAHGTALGGKLDLYRVFAERAQQLLGPNGAVGMVVPSAFHANEGATGVRQLYLQHTRLEWCLSFENRKKLFDIDGRFKFALIVARRPGPTLNVRCGFYLTDIAQVDDAASLVDYDRQFICSSGGACKTFLELRSASDHLLLQQMLAGRGRFSVWSKTRGVLLSREVHMTDDAGLFTHRAGVSKTGSWLALCEGKMIHQFNDCWHARPRYMIASDRLAGKPRWLENARYFRAACREIASATNERTAIAAILPPGMLCGHTISVERRPAHRPNASALTTVGVMNSFAFDWLLRLKATVHVSLYLLADVPVPELTPEVDRFLAHACLRLSCNHQGFAPLWHEQLGDTWREDVRPHSWPVIAADEDRWRLRAAMDALVAQAYGLDRSDYERVLASFVHRSFPAAPSLCLGAFDELANRGLTNFCQEHDRYGDIPLAILIAEPASRMR
jgi:hypothetical protein